MKLVSPVHLRRECVFNAVYNTNLDPSHIRHTPGTEGIFEHYS